MDRTISKKGREEGKLKCSRCGFKIAECLEYRPEGLLCQNCILLRTSQKDIDVENMGKLLDQKIENEDDDIEEEYGSFIRAPKGFTLEILTNGEYLIPFEN